MTYKAQSGAHSKHILTYHLMWVIKYRRTVLTRAMSARCATERGYESYEAERSRKEGSHGEGYRGT